MPKTRGPTSCYFRHFDISLVFTLKLKVKKFKLAQADQNKLLNSITRT
jgi:hypothetical protein